MIPKLFSHLHYVLHCLLKWLLSPYCELISDTFSFFYLVIKQSLPSASVIFERFWIEFFIQLSFSNDPNKVSQFVECKQTYTPWFNEILKIPKKNVQYSKMKFKAKPLQSLKSKRFHNFTETTLQKMLSINVLME